MVAGVVVDGMVVVSMVEIEMGIELLGLGLGDGGLWIREWLGFQLGLGLGRVLVGSI